MKRTIFLTVFLTIFLTAFLLMGTVVSFSATTIRYSVWGAPTELPPYHEIINQFEAENPDIKVELISAPWSSYFDKIQTMMPCITHTESQIKHVLSNIVCDACSVPTLLNLRFKYGSFDKHETCMEHQ